MSAVLRNAYSTDEFSAEILNGKRKPEWVRKQCRLGKIKVTAKRPFLIPQSEAVKFIGAST